MVMKVTAKPVNGSSSPGLGSGRRVDGSGNGGVGNPRKTVAPDSAGAGSTTDDGSSDLRPARRNISTIRPEMMIPLITSSGVWTWWPSFCSTRAVATSMTHSSEVGISSFQPRFMNWS